MKIRERISYSQVRNRGRTHQARCRPPTLLPCFNGEGAGCSTREWPVWNEETRDCEGTLAVVAVVCSGPGYLASINMEASRCPSGTVVQATSPPLTWRGVEAVEGAWRGVEGVGGRSRRWLQSPLLTRRGLRGEHCQPSLVDRHLFPKMEGSRATNRTPPPQPR
jgi:hypothetical protein